jgi:hypothetical protein
MLNPEFRLLDPDAETIERLAQLADRPEDEQTAWEDQLLSAGPEHQEQALRRLAAELAAPGSHPQLELCRKLQALSAETNLAPLEPFVYGWPDSTLAPVLERFQDPCVLLFGVLDGEGVWAGVVAGVSRGGLDFLSTFDLLWTEAPELAAQQSLAGLPALCQAARIRFDRPAGGWFIFRDEFLAWQAEGWARGTLEGFLQQGTAAEQWPA